ncbi:16S rRNA processing protein RimM [Palleronia aestuarii]|uniref:Ribosome maturation factor RimM n=1 Tax=Palleronia aestuarii TaxID=568105 RepID=A0A2W7NWZ3_9RHOB|nr:ribosome maturation factor RimM [Palleronia aestuarii]PZX15762.1 16S rRNA processing protein RimM [Palleronia aestuarii]
MTELICVGAIAGAFGVRGEVRLKSFCSEPEAIADYSPLVTEDERRSFEVDLTGRVKGGFTARLSGIDSKEAAETLRGTTLHAPRDRLPPLPDDEFYHADLIGLAVLDTGGATLGHVREILNHGATDLLEIATPGHSDTILLPFTRDAVPTVDLPSKRIIADPPDGLFPDPESDPRQRDDEAPS